MTKKVCSGCGYATTDLSAVYCPNCGSAMVDYNEQPSAPAQLRCSYCGNDVSPNMKFCAKCGSPLAPATASQPVPPVYANPAPQPARAPVLVNTPDSTIIPVSPSKFYSLGSLFSVPNASLRVNNKKHGGKLVMTPKGVAFDGRGASYNALAGTMVGGGIRFLIPSTAVTEVSLGSKGNTFIVYLKDGDSREFKVYNAKKWVDAIKAQIGSE